MTPDTILVAADIEYVHHEEREQIHTCESGPVKLFRAIHLPRRIDPEMVKAEFTNGMLKLKATVADKTRTEKKCGCFVKSSIEIWLI